METDRDVEDFLENHLEGVCFAEFCNASCNDLTQRDLHFDADKTLSAYADEAREHGRIVT